MTLDEKRQAGSEIEITEAMVEAGIRVLVKSGAVDDLMEADSLLVQEIYLEMQRLSPVVSPR